MEGLTTTLSRESSSSVTNILTFDDFPPLTTDTSLGDSQSVSDITSSEETNCGSTDAIPFNDRSVEVRDARLAASLQNLDEDVPLCVDDSIKSLLGVYQVPRRALGPMTFLVDENYLEYKSNLAAKQKKLRRSKGRKPTDQNIDLPANETEPTPERPDIPIPT